MCGCAAVGVEQVLWFSRLNIPLRNFCCLQNVAVPTPASGLPSDHHAFFVINMEWTSEVVREAPQINVFFIIVSFILVCLVTAIVNPNYDKDQWYSMQIKSKLLLHKDKNLQHSKITNQQSTR